MEMNVDEKVRKYQSVEIFSLIAGDLQTIRDLEQELHVELLPGTEIMIDSGEHHFVKASGSTDRVLVPQPSNDPHDPLVSHPQIEGPQNLTSEWH
jgi:mannose-6-phosphate isomerase-like protein (cupin superfamily)